MLGINPYSWEGDVTEENREQVVRALQERMPTRHVMVNNHELFRAHDLIEGDHVAFSEERVVLTLVYGRVEKEYKTVIIG